MASLKDMRKRIASVKATKKITRAMQMVAAAKFRRAQEAAESARPYAERMDAVLANLSSAMRNVDNAPALLVGTGDAAVHLLVVATADRGLCGPFNSSIVRLARERIHALKAEGKEAKIMCIGKKGHDQLKRSHAASIVDVVTLQTQRQITFAAAARIAARIAERFERGEFDRASLFYGRFKSVLSQVPTERQLIPALVPDDSARKAVAESAVYDYEPDEKDVLEELLPRNLSVQIFRALLENAASFSGAQMTAMDSATRNAGEMIDQLTIKYNRTRQAMITKELIEIISGAEAL